MINRTPTAESLIVLKAHPLVLDEDTKASLSCGIGHWYAAKGQQVVNRSIAPVSMLGRSGAVAAAAQHNGRHGEGDVAVAA